MVKFRKKILYAAGILICCVIFFLFLFIPLVHSFLSQSKPVHASVLVISGWHWRFNVMMDQAEKEFKDKNYQHVILTGDTTDIARVKIVLILRGIPAEKIEEAPRFYNKRFQNTFQEADGLKRYLEKKMPGTRSINVVAGSMHAKKTHVIFSKVLGDSVKVGILAFKTGYYDEKKVWASPNAVKWTIEYFIGYLYALVWKFHAT